MHLFLNKNQPFYHFRILIIVFNKQYLKRNYIVNKNINYFCKNKLIIYK